MNNIIIYSSRFCPYCFAAKKLLKNMNLEYEEIYIDGNRKKKEEMIDKTNRFTVPQIFINDIHIGGFDDLSEKKRNGKLDKILIQK